MKRVIGVRSENSAALMCIGPKPVTNGPDDLVRVTSHSLLKTIGTGTVFTYGRHLWVMTARHVVEAEPLPEGMCYKAVVKWETSNSTVEKCTFVLDYKQLKFHPKDSQRETYDVAYFWVSSEETLIKKGMQHLYFSTTPKYPICKPETGLTAIGYPTEAISRKILNSSTSRLPVQKISGHLYSEVPKSIKPDNLEILQLNQYTVLHDLIEKDTSGMSGGPVVLSQTDQLIGIVTSGGTGCLMSAGPNYSLEENLGFFNFTYIGDIIAGLNLLTGAVSY